MKRLARGERLALAASAPDGVLQADVQGDGLAFDVACFALGADGKLVDDAYMTFFNQPATPCGGVRIDAQGGSGTRFRFDLERLPSRVQRLVVTAVVDGAGTMAQLRAGSVDLAGRDGAFAGFDFSGADFAREQAVMLVELYRKDGQWRAMAVGQGFEGGLAALVRHFGADVAAEAPVPAPAPAPPAVSLDKRIATEAPALVNLVKSAGVSLAKAGLDRHRARVCLVLDISGSMSGLYRKGLVQRFAERILALGCRFDDDGEIDVFLFGRDVHRDEPMGLANFASYVGRMIERHPLEGDTRYGAAMQAVRRYYFPDAGGGERSEPFAAELPVYVMFVTDGTTSDKPLTERQLRWSSREPVFWQFMGIGKGKKSKSRLLASVADSDFPFLEKLDELDGRLVDNAGFFSVASPDEHADEALFDLLMAEYPSWLALARRSGLLR